MLGHYNILVVPYHFIRACLTETLNVVKFKVAECVFNITPLITDIPHCRPRHFPFGGSLPPPHIESTERRQSLSQSAGIEGGGSDFFGSQFLTDISPSRQRKSPGLKKQTNKRKQIFRRALHPM